jgi:nicotinamide mononucleotide transporter
MFFFPGEPNTALATLLFWLFSNYIEILATLTGLIYLVYSVRGIIWLWFFGILTSILYVYVFFQAKIYADMSINVYYVLISMYGWYHWVFGKNRDQDELPVGRVERKQSIILLGITLALFLFIAFILKKFTDSDIAVFDALTTSASITATWMLARKMLEHWLIWICVDALSMGLYIFKGLYPTVILFGFYTALAVLGYFAWKKKWKEQENTVSGSY